MIAAVPVATETPPANGAGSGPGDSTTALPAGAPKDFLRLPSERVVLPFPVNRGRVGLRRAEACIHRSTGLASVPKRPQWMAHRQPASFDDMPHAAERGPADRRRRDFPGLRSEASQPPSASGPPFGSRRTQGERGASRHGQKTGELGTGGWAETIGWLGVPEPRDQGWFHVKPRRGAAGSETRRREVKK